jgi:hypothetical protein
MQLLLANSRTRHRKLPQTQFLEIGLQVLIVRCSLLPVCQQTNTSPQFWRSETLRGVKVSPDEGTAAFRLKCMRQADYSNCEMTAVARSLPRLWPLTTSSAPEPNRSNATTCANSNTSATRLPSKPRRRELRGKETFSEEYPLGHGDADEFAAENACCNACG